MLAVALLVLAMGMIIATFGSGSGAAALDEAARRMETALRMARAEAANRGRRFRLDFDPEADATLRVLWEPDPLTSPGQFVPFEAASWPSLIQVEGVRAESCRYVGSSAWRSAEQSTAAVTADAARAPITFEPDGSSDSVVIELVWEEAPEGLRAVIGIEGITGTITSRIVAPEGLE